MKNIDAARTENAQQRRIATRPRHGAGKAIEKLAPTRQLGQEIDLREFSEQLLQFLLPRDTTNLGGDVMIRQSSAVRARNLVSKI